jgi:metal transporter CNNM
VLPLRKKGNQLLVTILLGVAISNSAISIFGEEGGTYLSKSQMKKLFQQYEKDKMLQPGERKMLSAALELKTKIIGEVMTPITKIFMLDINQTLDEALKRTIYEQGYSRIPIYEDTPENIIGILMSRDLILANIDDNLTTL